MANVVFVDDSDIILESLNALLSREEDIKVVGEASSLEGAVALFEQLKEEGVSVDVAIVDGLGSDGRKVADHFREIFPKGKVIAYSSEIRFFGDENVLKPSTELADVIRRLSS